MRRCLAFAVALLVLVSGVAAADDKPLARTILALYDGELDSDIRFTGIHRILELPLNHLGLVARYHDLRQPLPEGAALDGVRGALVWFSGDVMPNPVGFTEWAHRLIDGGRKLVIFGGLGLANDRRGKPTPLETVNGLLERIGLRFDERHIEFTQDVRVVRKDRTILEFETPLPRQLPAYDRIAKVDARTQTYLVLREGTDAGTDAALITTHPNGGMVAGDLVHRGDYTTPIKQLYINPFEYLRRAFATDEVPKADTTTLVGRRIYYSHIDGDGWRNVTQVKEYAQRRAMSAEVVMREAIEAFPDLPVTVGAIVGDLDPAWFGSEQSQQIARDLFSLPQVEMASHTWSHPFDWGFFAEGDATKEVPLLKRYPHRPGGNDETLWAPVIRNAANKRDLGDSTYSGKVAGSIGSYAVPRVYAVKPFDLDLEIAGSIAFLNGLAPAGKQVALLQWSGNCLPWDEAVVASYQAGVLNLNGGDGRFDRERPSYTALAPVGRRLARGIQIYSSNANENVYTELWTDRFFGHAFLAQTWRNTETPIRVKPKNLYYHMYSGERAASLRALLGNLREAEAEPIVPIAASEFSALALGFYTAEIRDLGQSRWQVTDRGRLGTIRFDRALDRKVDFARSSGVLGQMHLQGSLYVALDPADPRPVVALAANPRPDQVPDAQRPYLVDSRWPVRDLAADAGSFTFQAAGYGAGEMTWKVVRPGRYEILAEDGERTLDSFADAGGDGLLTFTLRTRRFVPARVTVRHLPAS
jgi:hypothetical protein